MKSWFYFGLLVMSCLNTAVWAIDEHQSYLIGSWQCDMHSDYGYGAVYKSTDIREYHADGTMKLMRTQFEYDYDEFLKIMLHTLYANWQIEPSNEPNIDFMMNTTNRRTDMVWFVGQDEEGKWSVQKSDEAVESINHIPYRPWMNNINIIDENSFLSSRDGITNGLCQRITIAPMQDAL